MQRGSLGQKDAPPSGDGAGVVGLREPGRTRLTAGGNGHGPVLSLTHALLSVREDVVVVVPAGEIEQRPLGQEAETGLGQAPPSLALEPRLELVLETMQI